MDEFAGYIDFRQDINSWFSLDAGIRVDHHSHVGTEWIPQGGLAGVNIYISRIVCWRARYPTESTFIISMGIM